MLTRDAQRMELYYIINYYIKYVELIDTVFLALKKKPLGAFSHIYILPLYKRFILITTRLPFQPSYTYSTMLLLHCSAIINLMEGHRSYVLASPITAR
jgi:hypothetical protein